MTTATASIPDRIRALATPALAAAGVELVDVEWIREGGRWIVRVFIDKLGGVQLEDCSSVSRQIEVLLDLEDPIEHEYALEVSSPGIERPLRLPAHFERFTGRQAVLKTYGPLFEPPRKNFTGKLLGISTDGVVAIECDGVRFDIPLDRIGKAHLAFDFEAYERDQGPGLPGRGGKKKKAKKDNK